MYSSSVQRSKIKFSWLQCCQYRDKGSIDMINPTNSFISFMVKWIIKACEPYTFKFHTYFRFKLNNFQSYT